MMLNAITTPTIDPEESELLVSVTALESTAMYSNIHVLLLSTQLKPKAAHTGRDFDYLMIRIFSNDVGKHFS